MLQKEQRKKKEEALKNQNIPFPGWEALENEKFETKAQLVFVIKNEAGEVIRNIIKDAKSGINRTAWDLRYPNPNPIALNDTKSSNAEEGPKGLLAPPGTYSVTMYMSHNGTVKQLDAPVQFKVKPLYKSTLESARPEVASAFWRSFEETSRKVFEIDKSILKAEKQTNAFHKAMINSTASSETGLKQLAAITNQINTLKSDYYGNQAKLEVGEKNPQTVNDKMFSIYLSIERSTYGPTETNKKQMGIINNMLIKASTDLQAIKNNITQLEQVLKASGAPYIDD